MIWTTTHPADQGHHTFLAIEYGQRNSRGARIMRWINRRIIHAPVFMYTTHIDGKERWTEDNR